MGASVMAAAVAEEVGVVREREPDRSVEAPRGDEDVRSADACVAGAAALRILLFDRGWPRSASGCTAASILSRPYACSAANRL
jgi:hypothetical protein